MFCVCVQYRINVGAALSGVKMEGKGERGQEKGVKAGHAYHGSTIPFTRVSWSGWAFAARAQQHL